MSQLPNFRKLSKLTRQTIIEPTNTDYRYTNSDAAQNRDQDLMIYNFPSYGAFRYGGALPVDPKRITSVHLQSSSSIWKHHYTVYPKRLVLYQTLICDK